MLSYKQNFQFMQKIRILVLLGQILSIIKGSQSDSQCQHGLIADGWDCIC
jgi:hypothetical protein